MSSWSDVLDIMKETDNGRHFRPWFGAESVHAEMENIIASLSYLLDNQERSSVGVIEPDGELFFFAAHEHDGPRSSALGELPANDCASLSSAPAWCSVSLPMLPPVPSWLPSMPPLDAPVIPCISPLPRSTIVPSCCFRLPPLRTRRRSLRRP